MLAEIIHGIAALTQFPSPYRPRPSLAGPDRCLRQLTYLAQGVEGRPAPGRLMLIFDDSSWHEELTLNWLRQSLYQIHSEQMAVNLPGALHWLKSAPAWQCGLCTKRADQEIWIPADSLHGHLDALFTDLLDTDRLLEHKAIEYFVFQRYWSGEHAPLDYFAQCVLYFRGLHHTVPDLCEGALLIKNKDTSAYLEYALHYDHATDTLTVPEMIYSTGERKPVSLVYHGLYGTILNQFAQVDAHQRAGTLPDRQLDPEDWRCRYCAFKDLCWDDYEPPMLDHRITLPAELEALAHEYLRLDRDVAPQTKRLEAIERELKLALRAMHAAEARGEGVLLQITQRKRTALDQQRLPVSLKALYSKTTVVESLKIRALEPPTLPATCSPHEPPAASTPPNGLCPSRTKESDHVPTLRHDSGPQQPALSAPHWADSTGAHSSQRHQRQELPGRDPLLSRPP